MSDEQSTQQSARVPFDSGVVAVGGDYITGSVRHIIGGDYNHPELKADVQLPAQEQMRVKLLPATLLYSLEEYRSDQGVWFAAAGLFVGAALGVLINWVTGGAMTIASWVVIAVLLFAAGVFGYFYHQQSKRIERAKAQLFGDSVTKG